MNSRCSTGARAKPELGAPMAFSTGFRVLRYQLSLPRVSPVRFRRLRQGISELRFLSVSKSSRHVVRPVAARHREEESSVEEEEEGNGSVRVKDRNSDGKGGDGRGIVPTVLHKEATEAYMAYAMSVLLGRALPDIRDGLKPVHRRILFAMHELGLSSRKPHKKCARVVGEVLGKFHPHGDTAVYDSLVRMAQDFSLRFPLIRGHGNFGSIDADPPAAMRYTECRLEALSEAMLLADLEQDTVDFVPNFDNSQKEPSLLPARIPNLLLNGSSGIAVGMATNIPPHNLGELVDALSVLIHNPEATLQELLEYMPGPDFPTGGLIMGNTGILEAYRSGRGRIVVRGKADIELLDSKTKRTAIVITEIPYQANKASLVEKIAELVENKSLEGISDIRDESDRTGMRIVIELKRGSDPSIVLNNLYRLTALQSSFNCNMVGILNRKPQLMGLKELLQAFLDFRCSIVERRARYKLLQAQDRSHIVEGIIVGLDNLDGVIDIIRKASSNALASAALRNEFNLSEKQAEAILDISLRKLTMLERNKFVDESKSLMEQIFKLQELLSSKKQILQLIEQEAIEIKNKFSSPRRSLLEDTDSGQLEEIDVVPNEEMLLAFSEKGYVKRMKPNMFNLQNRGTIGKSVGKLRVNDTMSDFLVCHAHDHVLYFSDRGTVYSARAYKIPECSRAAAGTPLLQILSLSDGERITSIIPVNEFDGDQYLLMLTAKGYIKKVSLNYFSSIRSTGIIAIQLVPGDELKWVRRCTNDDLVAMASQNGMVILTSCGTIRAVGRNTRGSIAMRLKDGDKIASTDIIPAIMRKELDRVSEDSHGRGRGMSGPWLLFVSENGFGKRVPLGSFRVSPLNRVGLIGYKLSSKDCLAAVFVVGFSLADDGESDEEVVLLSQSGTVNRIKIRDVSIQSRYARGVILMRLDHTGKIQSASLISATESEPEEIEAVSSFK
ncbi:DNA gyrase subunit A, chloroplastic/mitochondrial isoform X18 [Diospyros lotus]|uniref:DNA gyrase subunit A, chloroplastic/mitochondrial isoform X1 n=1 Tax=Diospyros lotus TaxID=55363 RepID=UPI0022501CDD|nr:DNA gyrase subunit A, chloroplastic/mitochondrial isoform X1 [Diospyros lotus]XP_052192184.1 DNA gyrase subunit A, chloroplastic/mitochondrial isoform X2 [Diospyros lotus]XP_052192185.1 DNA gyrase subunit A, chloroplastic/mitochondrial isoform X3 [Diospyros lotus]XP_052192186.1 DNA gyrase subunit A, chloroplastic/mitochondrial isoform X4 [Diospyros lotus]XP_052192187.1 DNA gyrase subunit A, chloroplastic/mitochondrial isoform X5 [Diospyros lotus]XP_052192188.1 DNA gyrase subunit A, chloropl